ncbi:DNA polymerase III subunit chi [mine drainage metagenome]|jgi:DNA polymerase-3 subunit chi|uniref:DNA polymerase III subunit chi n=1 Tax=mine drainage metagenome TaxID=410659 RepID=A0A1J5QD49_9ZZZZ
MTQVEFRVGAGDPLGYACALLRSAQAKGARLLVRVDDAQLDALDERLWTFSALDFLPHCRVGDALQPRSPIVLGGAATVDAGDARDCLVNLAETPPQGWQTWPRVIEIVGADAAAKAAARQRFRAYRDAGCAPTTMEVES